MPWTPSPDSGGGPIGTIGPIPENPIGVLMPRVLGGSDWGGVRGVQNPPASSAYPP